MILEHDNNNYINNSKIPVTVVSNNTPPFEARAISRLELNERRSTSCRVHVLLPS